MMRTRRPAMRRITCATPAAVTLRVAVAAGVLAMALLLPARAHAQDAVAVSGSGDAWVDAALLDINHYAARYPDAFADELVRYDSAPRALVEQLLGNRNWTPGDIYFACALGQAAGQPCRAVAARWQQDRASGWAAIARSFGVASDSDAFHRLKRGIVLSYQHWARPLQVDASLHAEFPKLPLAAPAGDAGKPAHATSQGGKPAKTSRKPKPARAP